MMENSEDIEKIDKIKKIEMPSKEEMRDFINFFGNLNSKIDVSEVLTDSGVRFLVMIENKKDSWIYSNELPDNTIRKFITEYFFNDPRAMESVMKRLEFVKKVFDTPKGRYKSDGQIEPKETREEKLTIEGQNIIVSEQMLEPTTKPTPTPEPTTPLEPEPEKFPDPKPDDYLTPNDVAKKYQISPKTQANWRSQGKGPEYFKLGNKVRYLRKNVEKWVEQSRVRIYNKKQ
jgi:predicted DNA-binding transcriptional regulator AlpA